MKYLIFLILFLGLVGCGEPPVSSKPYVPEKIISLNNGQIVARIDFPEFNDWLENHKNITIITMCTVSNTKYADSNPTTGILITYTVGAEK